MAKTLRATDRFPAILTVGAGTAVAMWIVGFVTHLPVVPLRPEAVGVLFMVVQAAGGFLAGRSEARGSALAVGVGSGLITALINLLIVGSVVAEADKTNTLRPGWPLIIGGSFVFCGIVGGVGALAGRQAAKREAVSPLSDARRWLSRFAVVAAASALPVLLSGGLVTSTGAGLAVPDWPTSYSANMFLYPLSKMTGGIYYEHAHRLFGSLVGLTTLTLLVFVLIAEPRKWVKGLGGFAFLFVCVQGYLGGVRVTSADAVAPDTLADNQGSLVLAMVHGVTGQLFFATLCVLAAVLGAGWITLDRRKAAADRGLRALSGLLFGGLVVQLAMGSAARHMNHPHALWAHVGFAVIVLVLAALAAFRAMGRHRALDSVRRLGHAVIHTVGLQVVLGVITLMLVLPYQRGKVDPPAAVLLATAHQATGAILIGASAMLGAWALLVNTSGQPGKRFSRAPDGSL